MENNDNQKEYPQENSHQVPRVLSHGLRITPEPTKFNPSFTKKD